MDHRAALLFPGQLLMTRRPATPAVEASRKLVSDLKGGACFTTGKIWMHWIVVYFFNDRYADVGCNVVILSMGRTENALHFEVVWPHYDDNSRSRIDQAKSNFFKTEYNPEIATTPDLSSSFCKLIDIRALFYRITWPVGSE